MSEHSGEREVPMPLHNLLRHVAGYVSRGCARCDWLLERGYITEEDCYE